MEKKSKFELFQKHKIEGLQQIVGGHVGTKWVGGPKAGQWDMWMTEQEMLNPVNQSYSMLNDWSGWGRGDVADSISGGPANPTNPQEWVGAVPDGYSFMQI